uniref:Uncharacterized protein n=1 Tax=Rhizophora mucronata TaxID=61149 RepID=A0A2P2QW30_RHIMU
MKNKTSIGSFVGTCSKLEAKGYKGKEKLKKQSLRANC